MNHRRWLLYGLSGSIGICIGFLLGIMLMMAVEHKDSCTPRYRIRDFPKLSATFAQNHYGFEKYWVFECIGNEKDCGVTEIRDVGTLPLMTLGLLIMGWLGYGNRQA